MRDWFMMIRRARILICWLLLGTAGTMSRQIRAQEPAANQPTTEKPAAQRPAYHSATSDEAASERAMNAPVQSSPVEFEGKIPADQLAFLKSYTGESAKKITKEKQFNALLKQVTPKTTYHYGRDMALSETVDMLLHSGKVGVSLLKGRYVMVASSEGPYLSGRSFLWIDTEEGIALGGVYFRPVNGEPTPTLAVFSNQLRVSALTMSQLPADFLEAVRIWSAELNVPGILTRYFIPQSGRKYLLQHDEDLCKGDVRWPAVDGTACEQRMVDAAESDVEAAAFITRMHNAANATAWMLNGMGDAQAAWLEARKKQCGEAAGNLECWLRMTHKRTQVLIAKRKE